MPSSPGWFTTLNDELFFAAKDGDGSELWKTDGTTGGTVQVRDINPGDDDSFPSDFTVFQGEIYFPAVSQGDTELWGSDGSTGGTRRIVNIRQDGGSNPSEGSGFYVFNDQLYFNAKDGSDGVELWRSDGTPEGTEQVIDADPGDGSSWPFGFFEFDGDLFFIAEVFNNDVDQYLHHLFRVDGETGDAEQAFDFAIDHFEGLQIVGEHFYFSGLTDDNGYELYRSDGTATGTSIVRDIALGPADSSPGNFFDYEGKLYFTAGDTLDPVKQAPIPNLWVSDGTALGTRKLSALEVNPNHQFVEYKNEIFFTAKSETLGWELHKTDGSITGTEVAADINGGEGDSFAIAKTVFEDQLLFLAKEPSSGWEIWAYDGIATTMIDVHLGGGDVTSEPAFFQFTEFGNDLVFRGSNPFYGEELFIIRGTTPTQPERLPGDADENGTVDFLDFLALANNFGSENATWGQGDFDGNGIVNFLDFLELANNFGRTVAASAAALQDPAAFDAVYAEDSADEDDDLVATL